MLGLTLAMTLQVSVLSAGTTNPHTYDEARQLAANEGTPIVALVGAKWCPACVQMKKNIMPRLAKEGKLDHVSYVEIDIDTQKTIGKQMLQGNTIPQLVMYYKQGDGWIPRRLTGGQSESTVEQFIHEGEKLNRRGQADDKTAVSIAGINVQ